MKLTYDGQRTESTAAEYIRQYLSGRNELIDDLDTIERAAAAWRTTLAEPLIASVTPERPAVHPARHADHRAN